MSTISAVDRQAVLDMGSKYFPGHAWLCVFGARIKRTGTPASHFDVLVVFLDAAAPRKKCVFVEAGQRFDVICADLTVLRAMVEHGRRSTHLSLARCIVESICFRQSMLAAATALCARRDVQPLLLLAQHVLDKLGNSLADGYETSLALPAR